MLSNVIDYYMIMLEETKHSEQQEKNVDQNNKLNESAEIPKDKKGFWRLFFRFSGFTLAFAFISISVIIIGLILFYKSGTETVVTAGKWMTVAGVVLFLFTVIFGFERFDK